MRNVGKKMTVREIKKVKNKNKNRVKNREPQKENIEQRYEKGREENNYGESECYISPILV